MATERMPARHANVNWCTASPVWFDEAAFDPSCTEFSADSYAIDLLRYVPLDTLRKRLQEYADELRCKLFQLVNEDYDEFANLSRRLVSVDEAIQGLERPLGAARTEIERVRYKLLVHLSSIKEAMRRREHVSELRISLELRKNAAQSLANIRALVVSLDSDRDSGRHKQPVEELCKNLDRICGELGRLMYVVHVNDIDSLEVDSIKGTIEAKLESALVAVLEQQDPSSFGTLLHAFSTIGCVATAERVVRQQTIANAVRISSTETSVSSARSGSNSALSATTPACMLGRIRDGLKRDVWPFLEAANVVCGSALPFDFVGGSVLPEVIEVLESLYPTMYSPGNPDEFHETYTSLEAFISDLESLCTSKDQMTRFRGSAARKSNRSKWNVAAYFSLRFHDIASSFENCLPDTMTLLSDGDMATRVTASVAACIDAMRKCMAQEVFLPRIADRLVRLQLQIFARFIDWIGEVAHAAKMNPSVEPNALAFLYCRLSSIDVSTLLMEDVRRRITDDRTIAIVQGAYQESGALLLGNAGIFLHLAAEAIARKCVECLGQIRGILAALRMTSRTPTAPAQYASAILLPLYQFLESKGEIGRETSQTTSNSSPEAERTICNEVVSKAATQFCLVVQETLETAKRTEESLEKLRSRKEKADIAIEKEKQDKSESRRVSSMMATQLKLDVEEFIQRASKLVNVDELDSIAQLRQAVVY